MKQTERPPRGGKKSLVPSFVTVDTRDLGLKNIRRQRSESL